LIWESAKVDDKKEYWQKYQEKKEEIELDKDGKLSLITWLIQKIPERKIRFQTPDIFDSLSENENETWRAPNHGENESVLGSECLTNLNADGLEKWSKEYKIKKYCHSHDQRASLESTLQNENAQDMILNSSSYS